MVNMVGGPVGPVHCSNWALRQERAAAAPAAAADAGPSAFTVGDEDGGGEAGFDGGGSMAHMEHEGTAANGGAIDVLRDDAEVPGNFGGAACAGDTVDIRRLEAGFLHGEDSGLSLQAEL